ncbi:MAG: hypothetical protein WCP35_10980 [Verrucomicrobiota bacterium]
MKRTRKIVGLFVVGWALAACAAKPKPTPPPGPGPVAPPENRLVRREEFSLILEADSSVAQIESINVDVISMDAKNAARVVTDGPVKYRDSRSLGGAVKNHVFRNGGSVEMKVPSIAPVDSIVLWAELAAPSKGSDTRMLELPLTLDRKPTGELVANPMKVRLTANGWVRDK